MRIRKLLCAVVILCICLTVGTTVQASSGKSAINEYNKMLSKPTIQWTDKYDKESTSKLNFALVTIKVSAGSMSASCKITVKTADTDSTYK